MQSIILFTKALFKPNNNNDNNDTINNDKNNDKIHELTQTLTFMYSTKKINKQNCMYDNNGQITNYAQTHLNCEIMSINANNCNNLHFHKPGTFDIRPYWNSLRKEKQSFFDIRDNYKQFNKNKIDINISTETMPVCNNIIELNRSIYCDAMSDINIFNATYAKLILNNGEEIALDYNQNLSCFTFFDITEENPFFNGILTTQRMFIQTDGSYYTIKKYYANSNIFYQLFTLSNGYTMTWFLSKNIVLFIGHKRPSFISTTHQIKTIDFNEDNEYYKCNT
jgi:hypothetical protein